MQKKLFIGGVILVLLVAIPLTIFLLGQQQETQSKATAATTLSFSLTNPSAQVAAGQDFSVDINITPGTNQVSIIYATINYDATKVSTAGAGFVASNSFPTTLEGPTFSAGTIRFGLSIGADYTKAIQTASKVGTITFHALASTNGSQTQIASFDMGAQKTFAYSIAEEAGDGTGENVLLPNPAPLSILIANAAAAPTTVPQLPICNILKLDRATGGNAPFSIAFTAEGSDPDGTISKVTFDFGDGPSQDVTQTGGIGTNAVSVQASHTYNNPGTYIATTTLVDNNQNRSAVTAACSKTITITQAAVPTTAAGGKTSPTTAPTAPTTIVATPTPLAAAPTQPTAPTTIATNPNLVATGPGNNILTFGGIGVVLSIIGAVLFFAL